LHSLFSGKDVEGDHEGRAEELLWLTATKQPRGGHGEGGTLSLQDITSTQTNFPMVLLMYMHLTFKTKAITNVNFILIQKNCFIVCVSPYMLLKSCRQ
jgi:hypothetical protein